MIQIAQPYEKTKSSFASWLYLLTISCIILSAGEVVIAFILLFTKDDVDVTFFTDVFSEFGSLIDASLILVLMHNTLTTTWKKVISIYLIISVILKSLIGGFTIVMFILGIEQLIEDSGAVSIVGMVTLCGSFCVHIGMYVCYFLWEHTEEEEEITTTSLKQQAPKNVQYVQIPMEDLHKYQIAK